MTVPSHKIDRKLAPWIVEYGNDGVVTRNMLPSERESVKKFMLHYFYQEASVPKVGCPQFWNFIINSI